MRSILVVAVALAASIYAAQAQAASVAYVLKVSGPWILRGSTPPNVHAGQPLQSGDQIALAHAAEKTDAIVILNKQTNRVLVSRSCAVDACSGMIVIPMLKENGFLRRVLDLVMRRWEHDGDLKYTSVASRNPAGLFESVVKARDERANLRSVVGDLPAGGWLLVWNPIQSGEARPAIHVDVIVEDGKEVYASLSDIQPGLYQVRAFHRGASTNDAADSEAWVLAAEGCRYEDAQHFFDEAVDTASGWANDVSGDSARRFLRAALAEYASSMSPCR